MGHLAGETVVVVVEDGYGDPLDFQLEVFEMPDCPAMDLGSAAPLTVMGDTTGLPDVVPTSCSFNSGEMTYSFTAPADDTYTFDTNGSTFNTVLSVREATCGGAELDCNDDTVGQDSQVSVPLTAGQTVIVVVEGYFPADYGAFTLHINGSI